MERRRLAMMAAGAAAWIGGVLALTSPAFAHHLMDGELPRTAWQGLLSGLGHPVIGVDHLAFILGVGLLAHLAGRIVLVPLLFVAGTLLGCGLHIWGYDLPAAQLAVALSVAMAAVLVAIRARVPASLLMPLVAMAGVLHGYAYGESIVGAEPAPLGAYLLGFGLIQGVIATGSALALRAAIGRDYLREAGAMRLAGAGLGIAAAFALANAALAG